MHGISYEDANKKKKDGSCTLGVAIATGAKLLDIKHKSYGFIADLIETIN